MIDHLWNCFKRRRSTENFGETSAMTSNYSTEHAYVTVRDDEKLFSRIRMCDRLH